MEFEEYTQLGINERGEILWKNVYEQLQYNLAYHLFTATYHRLEWKDLVYFKAVSVTIPVHHNLALVFTLKPDKMLMIVVLQHNDMRCVTLYR
jgi:hypothetical protein